MTAAQPVSEAEPAHKGPARILLEPEVCPVGVSGLLWHAIQRCAALWGGSGIPELRITSLTEGAHVWNSLHPCGLAVDLGIQELPMAQRIRLYDALEELFPEADVIWEDRDNPNEHFHLELDLI